MTRTRRPVIEPAHEVIEDLAKSTHRPLEHVKRVYEQELASLEADARVTTFLAVIAKRRAREKLSRA